MPRQLLATYPRESPRFDEMFDHGLEVREHWRRLWAQLVASRPDEMMRRVRYVQRQVHENGITYNVYADPQGADRPWELDLLPMIIPAGEWEGIESAIAQRADLLNRILGDVYGNQYLLREGMLPPALIHGHSGFLRACHGIRPPGDFHLHLYAADLARSPDGSWWVIADRTQSPSGAGYALENRLVISRVFPDLFRDLHVQHLASFFGTLRDSLAQWAPGASGAPLIVLLTPGPYNETYFEHAYLARYLGFPLVEGTDLTVRDGCVWLKTLSGLQRVHVILRRLDDDFSDPIELRSDSALGVPGLTQAARLGNVLIANALGSNLLESNALMGFLPGLCERLLGEPLKMPSVATWWCGQPAALDDAIEKLDQLVIKGTFPQLRQEPIFGQDLKDEARAKLIAAMRAQPQNYVAQELVNLAQAPVWDKTQPRRLQARVVGLRVFACATPHGYVVMPGGLTRVGSQADARVLSMQRGGSSKDTWVLTPGQVSNFSLLRRSIGAGDLVRSGANLSSRVVENLFWLGRYTERSDNTARLLRIALDRLIDEGDGGQTAELPAILRLCRGMGMLSDLPRQPPDRALRDAILDAERPASLAANLRQLQRVGFSLRERLSVDNWRTINQLAVGVHELRGEAFTLGEAYGLLDRSVLTLMTLSGFALDGMTRDEGWRFLSLGRRLERLQFMCAILRHAIAAGALEHDWVLELGDSIVTYRSRYMARPERLPVLDLLLLDPANPRALVFQVKGIEDYLARLAEHHEGLADNPMQAPAAALRNCDLAAMLARPESGQLVAQLLADLQHAGYRLSEQIALRFFSHVDPGRQMVSA